MFTRLHSLPCGRLASLALLALAGLSAGDARADSKTLDEAPASLAAAIQATLDPDNLSPLMQIGTPIEGVDSAWQAPNHGLDMQSFFTPEGVRILPMLGDERWSFGMQLVSLQRGDEIREFGPLAPSREGERIEYQREGLVEWYVNRSTGLEQGFDLASRPLGTRRGPLVLNLDLQDSLAIRELESDRISLAAPHGEGQFSLGHLLTVDAQGTTLPSRFELRAGGFAIVVDDSTASYPITVDPLIVNEEDKFFIDRGVPGGRFGDVMDFSGSRAVVGAPGTTSLAGAAYVFQLESGSWVLEAKLTDIINESGSFFGGSVSIAGSHIAVGAYGSDYISFDGGLVCLFELDQNGWARTDRLSPPFPQGQASMGMTVELSGSWLFAGATRHDTGATDSGAVFVYKREAGDWSYHQQISPPTPAQDLHFGQTLATNGSTLAIGAPEQDLSLGTVGAVYLFEYDGAFDRWDYEQVLGTFGARGFGRSLDFYNSRLAIGAPYTPSGGNLRGAAYLFEDDGNLWNLDDTIPGQENGDLFGSSVCLDGLTALGQRLLVGVPGATYNNVSSPGLAQVYLLDNVTGWSLEDTIYPATIQTLGSFGRCVRMIGSSAYISSSMDSGELEDLGRVERFSRAGSDWQANGTLESRDQDPGDLAGWAVALDGNRAVVGVLSDDDSAQDGGAAYVYWRLGDNWWPQARLSAGREAEYLGRFGDSVDIEGSTIVVGAEAEDVDDAQNTGAAYVFDRSPQGDWSRTARLEMPAPVGFERFGGAVALSGDTIVVGARLDTGAADSSGTAYTFRALTEGSWTFEQKIQAPAGIAQDRFGCDVAIDGDLMVIGAELSNSPGIDSGSAYFFARSAGTWSFQDFVAESHDGMETNFGHAVGLSGNRAVIGASEDYTGEGCVHVYELTGNQWVRVRELRPSNGQPGDGFGMSLDIEGRNIIVGAADHDGIDFSSGAAYVYQNAGSAWVETQLVPSDGAINDHFGLSVAVTGEHYLVGAPYHNLDAADAGATYSFELEDLTPYFPYGFGDGSYGPCPCGNQTPAGAQEGCANSSGRGAKLLIEGSTSLAADDFALKGEGFPPGKTCLLIMATNRHLDGPQLGDGLLAVTGGITRVVYRTADANGEARWDDVHDFVTIGAEDTRTFQAWYRDSVNASCGTGSNLSSGLEVTFEQ